MSTIKNVERPHWEKNLLRRIYKGNVMDWQPEGWHEEEPGEWHLEVKCGHCGYKTMSLTDTCPKCGYAWEIRLGIYKWRRKGRKRNKHDKNHRHR